MSADASRPTPIRPGDAAATSGGTAQVPDTGTDKQSGNQQNPRGPRGLDQYLYSSGTSTPTEGFTGMEDRDKRPVSPAVLKFIEQAGPSSGSGGVSTPGGGISGGGKPSGGSADHSGSSGAAGASNGGDTGDKGSPTPTDSAATVPGGTPTAFDSTASQPAPAGASLILGAAIPASDSGAESPPTAQPTDSGTVESGGTSNADAVAPTEDKSDGSRAAESTLYSVRVADIGGAAGNGNTVQVSQDGHTYFVGISRASDNGVTTVTIGTGNQSENATVRLPDSVAGDTKITIRESSSPGKLAEIEVSAGRPVIDATSSNAFDVKLSTPFGPPTPESKIGLAKDSSPSPPALEKTTATKADKVAPPPGDTKHGEGSAKGAATSVKESAESFRTGLAETGRALEQKVAEVRDILTKHGIDPNRPQDLLHATPRQQLGVVKDLIEALQVPEASLPEQRARWELHYAKDAAEKAWHDLTNPNSTWLQRAEAFRRLGDMAPAAAVEQGFVKPLLDAPANALEAQEFTSRMLGHIVGGRLDLAVQDAQAAGSRSREAVLAVLGVIPAGWLEGAALKSEGMVSGAAKTVMQGAKEAAPAERALGSAAQKGVSRAASKGAKHVDDVAEVGKADREFAEFQDLIVAETGAPARAAGQPIKMLPYGARQEAGKELGLTKSVEATHGLPRAVGRDIPGYDPRHALTTLHERSVHRGMDQHWKEAFQQMRREGRTEATAHEVYETVAESIQRSGLPETEKASLKLRLQDEMFVEFGLPQNRPLVIPYPNIKPTGQ